MSVSGIESNPPPPPPVNPPAGVAPDKSLTLKDYLETATEASKRTRSITIIMVVASVLLMVSVLNSWDKGWMSLRLDALRHTTSKYTLEKFPLLCKCDLQVQANSQSRELCADLGKKHSVKDLYWNIERIDGELNVLGKELSDLNRRAGQPPEIQCETVLEKPDARQPQICKEIWGKENEVRAKQTERQKVCDEENKRLATFHDTYLRSVADTKYSVRLPFFGVALDVNDIGLLGGVSLLIILILLRLSLRSQIVSLRIGFKAARDSGHARWFYEILATRQMFVFPFLMDQYQSASVAVGWTEALWQKSAPGRLYQVLRRKLSRMMDHAKCEINARLKPRKEVTPVVAAQAAGSAPPAEEIKYAKGAQDAGEGDDVWRVNRNVSLRIVPKFLCLLPFLIYSTQVWFDFETRHYGDYLSEGRTRWLLRWDTFFLLATLGFGLWCVVKWNELDKLWDYFKDWESSSPDQSFPARSTGAEGSPNRELGAPGIVSGTPDSNPPSNPTTTD